jgi:hypothetical protein
LGYCRSSHHVRQMPAVHVLFDQRPAVLDKGQPGRLHADSLIHADTDFNNRHLWPALAFLEANQFPNLARDRQNFPIKTPNGAVKKNSRANNKSRFVKAIVVSLVRYQKSWVHWRLSIPPEAVKNGGRASMRLLPAIAPKISSRRLPAETRCTGNGNSFSSQSRCR